LTASLATVIGDMREAFLAMGMSRSVR
jgi:hypothetical protein